jgi:hypothetical protein
MSQPQQQPAASDKTPAGPEGWRQPAIANHPQGVTAEPEPRSTAAAQTDPTEQVYAPASARIPKPPAPGHEALVDQVDATTPERQAAEQERLSRSDT